MEDTAEDLVWKSINPDHIWVLDKLILSKKLGYNCGPTGIDVPQPGWYIVRPCINAMGMGLGAQRIFIEKETMHLPLGYFWCEWFDGDHYSVDYLPEYGTKILTVKGTKQSKEEFVKWDKWEKVDHKKKHKIPKLLFPVILDYYRINLEYIDSKLIEVHFRENEDFKNNISEFIPVWEGQKIVPPDGYKYIGYEDVGGRIGAFVK